MVCNQSKIKSVLLILLVLAALGASYFLTMLSRYRAQVWGWVGLCFFGVCLVLVVLRSFKKGPALAVNENGIEDFRTKWGLIPWTDIVYVKIGVLQTTRFICIEVKDPKAYLAKLPAWQRPLKASNATIDFPMIDINFSALTPGLDEVWNYIKTTHPEKIRS